MALGGAHLHPQRGEPVDLACGLLGAALGRVARGDLGLVARARVVRRVTRRGQLGSRLLELRELRARLLELLHRALVLGAQLRELLDPGVLADLELELQQLVDGRRARDPDEAHDVLRRLGDLTVEELDLRCDGPAAAWADELVEARRGIRVRIAGEDRLAAAEDAARMRDALGVPVPRGLPDAFLEPVERPLDDLVARYARTHGPFLTIHAATRLGAPADRVREAFASERRRELTRPETEIDARLTVSAAEKLGRKDFAQMSAAELAEAKRALAGLAMPDDRLQTRRLKTAPRGRFDARRAMRASLRVGG
ncbi:MAG: hypothetical protein KY463_03280, partial [Actinobacteria bacterium]|nr:hypothetical protein [Actinomycetota bacterium]